MVYFGNYFFRIFQKRQYYLQEGDVKANSITELVDAVTGHFVDHTDQSKLVGLICWTQSPQKTFSNFRKPQNSKCTEFNETSTSWSLRFLYEVSHHRITH